MSDCDVCGKQENMPYHCDHCGGTYCAQHRLPEAHDCPGLDNWNDPGGVFDSGFDESVTTDQPRERGLADRFTPDIGPGGMPAYFRGNMTYVFLALMGITFILQNVVLRLLHLPALHNALFVLRPQHPEYVWTWVTSIFAHAPSGIYHIAGNAIIIFFFGRIVENYVGSKKFTLLFLGSGVLAGLSQIAIQILQNPAVLTGAAAGGVLGASGAGLAVMGVLTVLNPDLRVYLWFLIPVPIWVITGFYLFASVFGVITPGAGLLGGNVADGAHLVGLAVGLWYGNRVKGKRRVPEQLQFGGGGGRGPGGPGGPGRGGGRGPF